MYMFQQLMKKEPYILKEELEGFGREKLYFNIKKRSNF